MKLPLKFDKNVCMNFLHSFFGGIFGGIIIAFSLGQTPQVQTMGYYFVFFILLLVFIFMGLLIMAYLNYRWERVKKRI